MMSLCLLGISSLLIQTCWSSPEAEVEKGCRTWYPQGGNVCCDLCNPGNRVVERCGPDPKKLCTPCEENTWTTDPTKLSCNPCKRCQGVLVLVEPCTKTKNTVCRCREGLRCENNECTSCCKECGRGEEPISRRSCRTCPDGTFNDQIHQKCKPWRTMCAHPDEYIVKGNASSDSTCHANATTTMKTTTATTTHEKNTELEDMLPWWLVIAMSCVTLVIPLILMIKIIKTLKEKEARRPLKEKEATKDRLIITTPTDEPMTLMAIECSFHEPSEDSEGSEGSTQKFLA